MGDRVKTFCGSTTNLEAMQEACRELARRVADGLEREELQEAKREVAGERSLDKFPSNREILDAARDLSLDDEVRRVLRKKPNRSLSGVSVVAVMTSPAECPHGRCAMCPGGPEEDTPQSYTGEEPAARRGARNLYDPERQVRNRVESLTSSGHPVDKVELIVMGGTFTSRSEEYRRRFVKSCLDALNGETSGSIAEAQRRNETAERRCVGMTLETRPDEVTPETARDALETGFTRVELGVQTLNDDALDTMDRGHTARDVEEADRLLRDLGFKVAHHWMPGFPGIERGEEVERFRELFTEPHRPDALKIYPTLVMEDTELHDAWRHGDYDPLTDGECAELVADLKELIPPWTRVKRVMRDIPSTEIAAGPTATNMRQLAWHELQNRGTRCRCVRCREVGRSDAEEIDPEPVARTYRASGGREHFLAYEDTEKDVLIGLLRLREPSEHRRHLEGSAVVRELHVYGDMVPVGGSGDAWQHRSYGEKLLSWAEERAAAAGYDRLSVISGVGAREYYRRLGYERSGPYVATDL